MNAHFRPRAATIRKADLADPEEVRRIGAYVAGHEQGSPFHRPVWLTATARGTGNNAVALIAETGEGLCGLLPLLDVRSPLFGRVMVSSGFGVGGGVLADDGDAAGLLFDALEKLALGTGCPTIELRGGMLPEGREGWEVCRTSHCGYISELAADDEAQLLAIPRKQRAEVRKGLAADLTVEIGSTASDRAAHYDVYSESVRNLGTPVFPRRLFAEVLDAFGTDADILTVRHQGKPVASVLSLYHDGAVMPYWGGGTLAARALRANDRMYYELMLHARRKGCTRFDFGRSKTGSGAGDFKKNWGFEGQPLGYAVWNAPGAERRDADPTSAKHASRIAMWKRLPLPIANLVGPFISRGLA